MVTENMTLDIDTSPMVEIKFPKVTVCPPKNTYTDLNYDLMMTENMTLDNDTRQELTNYADEILYETYTKYMNEYTGCLYKLSRINWLFGPLKCFKSNFNPVHVFLHFKSFCLVVLQLILASKLSE